MPKIVVMGVSGCGKSTLGSLLAEKLGADFLDADDLHSPEARAQMEAGIPLTDEDREPWLRGVGQRMASARAGGTVAACSALKRRYRDLIRAESDAAVFVHLTGSRDLLQGRMAARTGHFMPAGLQVSQLATLEPLQQDEPGVTLNIAETREALVHQALDWATRRA